MRLYVNYFQPSFKLVEKTRDGASVLKRYSPPATPCDRLMQHDTVSAKLMAKLSEFRAGLDPVALLHTIREAQSALVAVTSPGFSETPHGGSLDRFLAGLPGLWRQGEARPTHTARVRAPRRWRTREDPFEGVWCGVLLWLQDDPDATAKTLPERLQYNYPGRFTDAELRTLQRRVQLWRGIMAKNLVYAAAGEPRPEFHEIPGLALVGADPKC